MIVQSARSIRVKKSLRRIVKKLSATAEPVKGIPVAEVNYVAFTSISALVLLGAVNPALSFVSSDMPLIWNYIDGYCAIVTALDQLLDEDDYRQTQTKIKGLLNLISGLQLFAFTYNPHLVTALHLLGAPTLLAGLSFAVSMLFDAIIAAIDLYQVAKERDFDGWLEERCLEHAFIEKRLNEIAFENQILGDDIQDLVDENHKKMLLLQERRTEIEIMIHVRCEAHHHHYISPPGLSMILGKSSIDNSKNFNESDIQQTLDKQYILARNTLVIKAMSFVGMSILALTVFGLANPAQLALAGIIVTGLVALCYLYRHLNAGLPKVSSLSLFANTERSSDLEPALPENAAFT
jgi:hypothetical protein